MSTCRRWPRSRLSRLGPCSGCSGGTTRRLLHSRALASPFGFGRVTLIKASEDTRTEMPFVDDFDSPGILLNVVKAQTTVWFSARGIQLARSCWREHEPARWLCWSRPRLARGNVGLSSQAPYLSCSTAVDFQHVYNAAEARRSSNPLFAS